MKSPKPYDPTKYRLTQHAKQRQQQRAVGDLHIELIRYFGEDHYQKGGSVLSFIPKRQIAELRAAIDRCADVALVKGNEDQVITIMHMDQKIARTEFVS